MDRIRKALDLARRDRARVLIDEERELSASVTEPSPIASAVTPVIAAFVAPPPNPVVAAAPPGRTIEMLRSIAAPAPIISLASYVAPAARVPASTTPPIAPSRDDTPSSAPAALNEARESAAAHPAAMQPALPKPEAVAEPAEVLSLLSTAAPAAVATKRAEIAQAAPISVQPFSGVVAYTKTRVYTPTPGLLESKRIINPSRIDPAAAAFRMLRTQVLQRMEERGWRSLAILSPNSEDGKTTTAINLAVSLAYDHRHTTVLLVDCDLKRPGIAGILGIAPEFGLDDVLCGRAEVDQCLYHPEGFDRLVILPAREALANSSEMLSGSRARTLVSELHARYPERIVIFDLPPILGTDDALAFLPMADCALMVAAERSTKRQDLLRSMELVTRIPIVGTVLNRSAAVLRAYG